MKIKFNVDKAGAIKGGYNEAGEITLDVDVAAVGQEDRELIAKSLDYHGGVSTITAPRSGRVVYVRANAPTRDGLLAALRVAWGEVAALEAERDRAEAAELELTEREDAKALAGRLLKKRFNAPGSWEIDHGDGWRVLNYAKGRESELKTRNSPEWAEWVREIDRKNREEVAAAELQRLRDSLAQATADRKTLAEFLAEVPQDALRGTVKRLATSGESIAEIEKKIEDASPVTIFEDDEDDQDDDGE
jgi:hypothetical protein